MLDMIPTGASPAAVSLGSRIYYVISIWTCSGNADFAASDWSRVIAIWDGGLGHLRYRCGHPGWR